MLIYQKNLDKFGFKGNNNFFTFDLDIYAINYKNENVCELSNELY